MKREKVFIVLAADGATLNPEGHNVDNMQVIGWFNAGSVEELRERFISGDEDGRGFTELSIVECASNRLVPV